MGDARQKNRVPRLQHARYTHMVGRHQPITLRHRPSDVDKSMAVDPTTCWRNPKPAAAFRKTRPQHGERIPPPKHAVVENRTARHGRVTSIRGGKLSASTSFGVRAPPPSSSSGPRPRENTRGLNERTPQSATPPPPLACSSNSSRGSGPAAVSGEGRRPGI